MRYLKLKEKTYWNRIAFIQFPKKILFIIICTTLHNYFCGAASMSCSQKKKKHFYQNEIWFTGQCEIRIK